MEGHETETRNRADGETECGAGIRIDEMQALLLRENGLAADKDDPLLAVVTIHNAFLGELQGVLEKHNAALAAVMGEATERIVASVRQESQRFAEEFKEAAIRNTVAKVGEHQEAMGRFLGVLEAQNRELKQFGLMLSGIWMVLLLASGVLLWMR